MYIRDTCSQPSDIDWEDSFVCAHAGVLLGGPLALLELSTSYRGWRAKQTFAHHIAIDRFALGDGLKFSQVVFSDEM